MRRLALLLAALLGVASLCGGRAVRAQDRLDDPIHVFFSGRDCDTSMLELELWDRERDIWVAHPIHRRILADTCQIEEAGLLLNELRYRCLDPSGEGALGPWWVGVEVFEPGVIESCGPLAYEDRGTPGVRITSPRPGSVVRDASQRVRIEGAVQLGGRDATGYDVLVAVDVSASAERALAAGGPSLLELQCDAVERMLREVATRPDRMRVGLLATGSSLPGGTRVALRPTEDLGRVRSALSKLRRQRPGGAAVFTAGLVSGVDALTTAGVAAVARGEQPVLLVLADGRPALPFGGGASSDPRFRQRVDSALERAARAGVTVFVFALGGPGGGGPEFMAPSLERAGGRVLRAGAASEVAALSLMPTLPHVREVVLRNQSVDASSPAVVRPDGRFHAMLPLRAGTNRLEATATASNGRQASVSVELEFDDSAVRERLLEAEAERIRRTRERQRKELEVEAREEP